jgi:hypothetical protein
MSQFEKVLDELVADAPVARASWDDVQRRARRSSRRRRVMWAAIVVLGLAIAAPTVAVGGRLIGFFGGGTPVDTKSLSARELHVIGAMASGTSPREPVSKSEDASRVGASSLRLIATRNGHTFFVANAKGGGVCVSVGVVGSTRTLGSIACSPDFPSRSMPVLDQSVFGGPPERLSLTRLEGFADDSVSSVGILTAKGVEADTAVEQNVYSRTEDLPSAGVLGIVALDANGDRLHVLCFVRTGCAKQ